MKALSLHQPWASLIGLGIKTIETRSWSTRYRGPLAIASTKRPLGTGALSIGSWTNVTGEPIARGEQAMLGPGYDLLICPLGAVVATATLVDVVPMIGLHQVFGGDPFDAGPHSVVVTTGAVSAWYRGADTINEINDQLPYGDFRPGRFAWLLDDIEPTTRRCPACSPRPISGIGAFGTPLCGRCGGLGACEPIPVKGRQGLWEWAA